MTIKPWCTGKLSYATKAKAIERIERQRKNKRRGRPKGWNHDVHIAPYRCVSCHQWHIGGTITGGHFHSDHFGRVVHKWPAQPKERAHGDTE